jgi:hypothetical protein
MAKNWISKAVPKKNRGKFTAKATAAGKTVQEYAKEKAHSSNPTLRGEAQFAMRAKKGFKEGGKVEKEVESLKKELKHHEELPITKAHKLSHGGHVSMDEVTDSCGHSPMKRGGTIC